VLTLCTAAKPFLGPIAVTQRNAIASWTHLEPRPNVILFGTEEGTAETARDLGLTHIPAVARNRHGTPLLADILAQAEKHSTADLLVYVNADIILLPQFAQGLAKVRERFPKFLAVGRRTNLEITEPLQFSVGWQDQLQERLRREGHLETHTGIDFFAFPRGVYRDVPPLAIGRVWFDQWFIKYARQQHLPVVDLTAYSPIAHQNHDYSHVAGGRNLGTYGGVEADENLAYYGERPHAYTILSATHVMTASGAIRRVAFRKQAQAARTFFWEILVHRTHKIRKRLGLTRGARV
jgi:hypothetical protein